jgi:hypothetical protein
MLGRQVPVIHRPLIISLDPGKATGIAEYRVDTGEHRAGDLPEAEAMVYLRRNMQHSQLVVCEGIVINVSTAKKSQDVQASIRQIGVAMHLCLWYEVEFLIQNPSERKFGEALLEELGWYTVGSDHARSASGHLVAALARRLPAFRPRLVGSP